MNFESVFYYIHQHSKYYLNWAMGRDSSVGIATRYGLNGPRIESRWGRDFPHLPRQTLWPNHPHIQWISGLFPLGKAVGRGVDQPPPSNAEIKEREELYLSSLSGPWWSLLGWTLILPLFIWSNSKVLLVFCTNIYVSNPNSLRCPM